MTGVRDLTEKILPHEHAEETLLYPALAGPSAPAKPPPP